MVISTTITCFVYTHSKNLYYRHAHLNLKIKKYATVFSNIYKMIEKYVYKLSIFNLTNKPTPNLSHRFYISQCIA